jgi:hypothetical protein
MKSIWFAVLTLTLGASAAAPIRLQGQSGYALGLVPGESVSIPKPE